MTVRGLLLINHRGEKYFIEGGIKADKLGDLQFSPDDAVEADISLKDHLIDLDKVKAQAEIWRTDWNAGLPDPFPDLPLNVGPIIFQAFNVEAELPEFGDAVVTGSSSTIDES